MYWDSFDSGTDTGTATGWFYNGDLIEYVITCSKPLEDPYIETEDETEYGFGNAFIAHIVWLVRINLRKLPNHFL